MSSIHDSGISVTSISPSIPHSPAPGLWFKDGTLVLQAGALSFRVYGGFLADRSPVFHDMLGFPQPEDAPTIDGCPVVQLSDDENDLRSFLKALFDYEFFPPYPAKTDFVTMSGIIRLSTKYQVESLRKRALVHLSSAFPSDPTEYSPGSASWTIEGHEWMRVILFAREMSLDWILPLALYRASAMCSSAQVMSGIELDGIHLELNSADKLMCIEQSVALAKSASADIINFLWEPPVIATCRGVDDYERWRCMKSRFLCRKDAEGWRNGAFPLTLWMPGDWAQLDVCASCMSAMRAAHQQALDTFWEGLPQRFGFPGWAELEKIKEIALERPNSA
ncbi:hypothetical protein MVEN_00731400 [Mycena venus]|uniref:BTB domain-containing protein n=1 Tax=Mycena venus TaxID=2733690 RepID=A0A8H6YKN9_9AGAR|nr:hypothetical protein MVEN_00731400 [Mycena venus]